MLVSESQEHQLGAQYDSQVVATIGVYPDEALQQYVQQLGAQIAAAAERPKLTWTFRVVDAPAVNAFAVPGGYIYVTRGILAHFNSEAELAAVLGHEIGHVTARHTASQISKQQVAQLGLAVATVASSDVGRYAGVAQQGLGVLFLKFSRDDERQADELGLRYLQQTGYDPQQMGAVFSMLERVSAADSAGALPEWLATHPSPENRGEAIDRQIAALPEDSDVKVGRESYERRLDGLVYGIDPREGFFRRNEFFHPKLRFQVSFPEGWTTDNAKRAVTAVSPEQDAVVELTTVAQESAEGAARAFLAQEGIAPGLPTRGSLRGLPAVTARFAGETKEGPISGSALFVEYGGAVYRLVAYAPQEPWRHRQSQAERALESFRPVSDPAVLNVEPLRLDIRTIDHRTTIAELARDGSPVAAEKLALLNQVEIHTPLEPGRLIKWVVGKPLP
jgi:predicted Zn-dependent protease